MKKSFQTLLKEKLSAQELALVKKAHDLLGEIVVVEIPPELKDKEKIIGQAMLDFYPQIRAVFKKSSAISGTYRKRTLKKIAGTGSTETIYKEHGCTYKLDIAKVFFNPRLETERLRIAQKVKKNETVLDMFAGVGPFSILIAKTQPDVKKIYSLDINKTAVQYLGENTRLNRVSGKVETFCGDASALIERKFKNSSDRIIMNLPRAEKNYFSSALKALKTKGTIHFYIHTSSEAEVQEKLKNSLKTVNFKILNLRKVLQYSPDEWNFGADISIKKS